LRQRQNSVEKSNMRQVLILFFYFNFACIVAQTPSIVGTWKLTKHITTNGKDKNYDCVKLMPGTTILLKINSDGTYEETYTDKNGKTTATVGKCKISSDNKKYSTYNNDFKPKIPKSTIADGTHEVARLTPTEFEYKVCMCTEGVEGISYFKRIK
jgi:hypothetical protein